jgi:hypothetical protein
MPPIPGGSALTRKLVANNAFVPMPRNLKPRVVAGDGLHEFPTYKQTPAQVGRGIQQDLAAKDADDYWKRFPVRRDSRVPTASLPANTGAKRAIHGTVPAIAAPRKKSLVDKARDFLDTARDKADIAKNQRRLDAMGREARAFAKGAGVPTAPKASLKSRLSSFLGFKAKSASRRRKLVRGYVC